MSQPKQIKKQPQKPKLKKLELSEDDLRKVRLAKARDASHKLEISDEWLTISEFGVYYGYDGVRAILRNEITLDKVRILITGAKKLEARLLYNQAKNNFYAFRATNTKKPTDQFNKDTKSLREKGE